jgi:uncharacterized membrane protein
MMIHSPIPVAFFTFLFFEVSRTAISMCCAGIALFLIGLWPAKNDVTQARGLDRIVALGSLCYAIPLAVFGAEHLSAAAFIAQLVPPYMPGRLFWAYFIGFALIAAALSMATRIQVRWSGLLFGIMMFLYDAMIHIPGSVADRHNRILWIIVLREASFGSGAWLLSASAPNGWNARTKKVIITVGRVIIGVAAIAFGIQHFFHPGLAFGVPLEKPMPDWLPARTAISYLTGAILLISGVCILLAKMTRTAATYAGTWILLLVLFVYTPILITALLDPSTAVKVEGINYFADTLLYAGVLLALARAMPKQE